LGGGDGIPVPLADYGAAVQGRTVGGVAGSACAMVAFVCGWHPIACRCGRSAAVTMPLLSAWWS